MKLGVIYLCTLSPTHLRRALQSLKSSTMATAGLRFCRYCGLSEGDVTSAVEFPSDRRKRRTYERKHHRRQRRAAAKCDGDSDSDGARAEEADALACHEAVCSAAFIQTPDVCFQTLAAPDAPVVQDRRKRRVRHDRCQRRSRL